VRAWDSGLRLSFRLLTSCGIPFHLLAYPGYILPLLPISVRCAPRAQPSKFPACSKAPSVHPARTQHPIPVACASALPAWLCFEKQTGPKAPSVIRPARTKHPIPFPWAGSLLAWSWFEKQTGPKAPSARHPTRTQHQILVPWAGSRPTWNCLEKQTGPKAPSVTHPATARTLHPIPSPWAGSLPAKNCVDKQTGPNAPSVSHHTRTQHPLPGPAPFPPGVVLKSRRGRKPRLSAIPPPPEHCIQFLVPGPFSEPRAERGEGERRRCWEGSHPPNRSTTP
jgi:hypothetical protein